MDNPKINYLELPYVAFLALFPQVAAQIPQSMTEYCIATQAYARVRLIPECKTIDVEIGDKTVY